MLLSPDGSRLYIAHNKVIASVSRSDNGDVSDFSCNFTFSLFAEPIS